MSVAGFVLDSSVALGAFFEDEQDAYSLAVWRSLDEARAFVPALWHLEMGNILSRALKGGRITSQAVEESWSRIDVVSLQSIAVPGEGRHWTQRAGDWGLSAFDACYLDLAQRQRLPLATKDRQLMAVARRIGVPLYLASLVESRS
ncbi:MAG: type II toxin-antitoxin system VapC family toxin [Methylibium sp.]|uniref:type II toxin-antitoxin system VapC family toxin n=1 Tax=Methylibium sp. TaxID=2067992 RepID=UPI001847C3D3|nr:type II toxin-antitoxin system VapC family toxin [Methylibium sp.]MBA2722260.1 type II toxin-antitoxin system VapC family toxin [Methylibium sp.]MBA3589931.1 type II toxin-antitoxin system VapC family toxin [Methylibium sp.]